jgi:hypothetical protein
MSTELSVLLNPQAVTTTPGSAPVEMSLSVENTSDDVHTYSVNVAGLETGWYTLSAPSVRLFKGTRDRVGLKIHPPRQRGLHKGAYPFRVLVKADDNGVEESAAGTLELTGESRYEVKVRPRTLEARREGRFQVEVKNVGSRDIQLQLSVPDGSGECDFQFSGDTHPLVREGQTLNVPLRVRPRGRELNPFYDFAISALPDDSAAAPQSAPGRFMPTRFIFPWWLVRWAFIGLGVLVFLLAVLSLTGLGEQGPLSGLRTWVSRLPIVSNIVSPPPPRPGCVFQHGFLEASNAAPNEIGQCVTGEVPDGFGNTRQYTTNGVLFWHNKANTVYFFKGNAFYDFPVDGSAVKIEKILPSP